MRPWMTGAFGNASSMHEQGRKARMAIEDARDQVAKLLGCKGRDVIFTSGGTEANNLALRGCAMAWGKPGRFVVNPLEHSSVLETCQQLGREGQELVWWAPDSQGRHTPDSLEKLLAGGPTLATVLLVNNEGGVSVDLPPIAKLCREKGVQLHTDGVQAVGHVPVNFESLGADTLSLSAHKFGGPQGIGALLARKEAKLAAVQRGGTHELGRRAGTENVAGAVGLAAALTESIERLSAHRVHWQKCREALESELSQVPGVRFNSRHEQAVSHIVNATFANLQGETLILRLDMEGVSLSSGSACHADKPEPSHVLKALGLSNQEASTALRFSFGATTTLEEVVEAAKKVRAMVGVLRGARA